MRKIKVLVVEDSLFFRELLVKSLAQDLAIEVVATEEDPYQARDAILQYEPDVMTLDVELPRMSGIEFLRKLMPQYPIPVVVISALSDSVFDALRAGAVEFVNKPINLNAQQLSEFMRRELVTKVKIASTVNVAGLKKPPQNTNVVTQTGVKKTDLVVAIGASTGGTEAIYEVVRQFGPDIPGTVIVQHMPPGFTTMYAQRLNNQCRVMVKEAQTGDCVMPVQVLIAPGDAHMRIVKMNGGYQVECKKGERVNGHCPSVDVLFDSVAKCVGNKALGIILTGMRRDGAAGLLHMRQAGARTIGQNEDSCIVYGMPKAAYDDGAVEYQADLSQIAAKTYQILQRM